MLEMLTVAQCVFVRLPSCLSHSKLFLRDLALQRSLCLCSCCNPANDEIRRCMDQQHKIKKTFHIHEAYWLASN